MAQRATSDKKFRARVATGRAGERHVVVPFDPDEVWGERQRHHVSGVIAGVCSSDSPATRARASTKPTRRIPRQHETRWRGPLQRTGKSFIMVLGPAWVRDCGIDLERTVSVSLHAEGPQRRELAPDLAAALQRAPDAARFFDSLATFYRKGYLRWVDATKRRPEVRRERITELVELLRAGHKQRPR